jgi:hypothetical protein
MVRNRGVNDFDTIGEQRLSAGVNYPLLVRGECLLEGTTLYERHVVAPPVPDFNRYRQRIELGFRNTGFSPLLYQDFTFLQSSGFVRSRSRAGIQWKSVGSYTLSVAYQLETINIPGTSSWLPRHSIVAGFDIEKPIWKSKR